jgi:hypothetical protein
VHLGVPTLKCLLSEYHPEKYNGDLENMPHVNALHKYGTLVEYTHAAGVAAQPANTLERSAVKQFGQDEAFQIDKIEIFPPVGVAPFPIENLLVQLILDGSLVENICLDSRMATPFAIGTPPFFPSCQLFGNRKSVDPTENYCLKGRKSLQIQTMGLIGGVAITSAYYVRVSGDWFKTDDALRDFFPSPTFNPQPVTINDGLRDRRVTVFRPLPINLDNWLNLPGGCIKAAKPRVLPWINFARNFVATTPNTKFALDAAVGHTQYAWENMHWDLDDKTFILNDYVGMQPDLVGQRLLSTWWEYGSEAYPGPIEPAGIRRWDTRFNFNELPIGASAEMGILSFHGPRAVDRKLLATNEIMEAEILDNGAAINNVAGDLALFCQWSRKIEF